MLSTMECGSRGSYGNCPRQSNPHRAIKENKRSSLHTCGGGGDRKRSFCFPNPLLPFNDDQA